MSGSNSFGKIKRIKNKTVLPKSQLRIGGAAAASMGEDPPKSPSIDAAAHHFRSPFTWFSLNTQVFPTQVLVKLNRNELIVD